VGRDDLDAREQLAEKLDRPPLVSRVRPGVEKADGHRLHAGLQDGAGHRLELALVEGSEDLASVGHPLCDLESQSPGDERLRLRVGEVVQIGTVGATDLQHIAEAPGGDERGGHPPALGDRVDDDGRPVDEALDRIRGHPRAPQSRHHPLVERLRGGGGLG
jgi:hypothetical protein